MIHTLPIVADLAAAEATLWTKPVIQRAPCQRVTELIITGPTEPTVNTSIKTRPFGRISGSIFIAARCSGARYMSAAFACPAARSTSAETPIAIVFFIFSTAPFCPLRFCRGKPA